MDGLLGERLAQAGETGGYADLDRTLRWEPVLISVRVPVWGMG